MEPKEKAEEIKSKFGELSNALIDEMLDNTNECRSRYRTNYDRVCIRQYWIEVRNELNAK